MKKIWRSLSVISCLFLATLNVLAQDNQTAKVDSLSSVRAKKEEKGRNVLLNAADNAGPREINVGLPSSLGGTNIRENDLPVVYYWWPELPNRAWRASKSLQRVGLLGLKEATLTSGEFGYAINSYSRLGGDDFHTFGNLSGSNFGWVKTDVNFSGPIKNGLSYTAGVYANYDPGSYDLGFTDYADRTQMINLGVTKYFKNGKGKISLLYKYIQCVSLKNYAISTFNEGGKVKEMDNFRIGRDSYLINSGQLRYLDAITGEYYNVNMGNSKDLRNSSQNITLLGDYKFDNDWAMKYVFRYRRTHASAFNYVPTTISTASASDGFTDMYGNAYTGDVQVIMTNNSRSTPINTFQSLIEFSKNLKNHQLRIGLKETFYNPGEYAFNRSFFYQEVGANPRQLTNYGSSSSNFATTDQYGFFKYNAGMGYYKGNENKLGAYLMDDLELTSRLDASLGVNVFYHSLNVDKYTGARTPNFTIIDKTLVNENDNWVNFGANLNLVYKISKQFGLNAQFMYSETNPLLNDFALGKDLDLTKIKSPYAGFGVFLNNPKISLVSAVNYLTKNNFQANLNLVNPDDATDVSSQAVNYDIKTMSWTTDIIAKPVNGFSLHYRLTLQDPTYENYTIEAFGNTYSYNGNNVTQISKVLMEIDPSLLMWKKKVRVWASMRYFSKQYANLTNALFFKGWWETFGGVSYNMNKNLQFGVNVINPLNQRGVKKEIKGAELATDASAYYGNTVVTEYIRPFTLEASINFNF